MGGPKLLGVPAELLYLAFVGVVLAFVGRGVSRSARREREQLLEIARRLGLRFVERMEGVPVPPLLAPPDPGREAGFVLEGTHSGLEVTIFDFSHRDQGRARYQTLFTFRLPGASVPVFLATPETLNERVAAATGAQDLDFDDDPEFSSAFWLRGDPAQRSPDEERALRLLFTPELRRALLAARPICIGGWDDRIAIWTRDQDVGPAGIPGRLATTAELARRFYQRSAKPPAAG